VLLDRALGSADEPVTLIGMSVSGLTTDDFLQLELEVDDGDILRAGSSLDLRQRALDSSVDDIRERFGQGLLKIGGTGRPGMVSDDFRKLAEHS
jgi:hypothetical protein